MSSAGGEAVATPPDGTREANSAPTAANEATYRSGWASTPNVPHAQSFVPTIEPHETDIHRRRREQKEEEERRRLEQEERERLEKEAEVARLEEERLAEEEEIFEAKRLAREREREAEAKRAELERSEAAKAEKQAELDRQEQQRKEREKIWVEVEMPKNKKPAVGEDGLGQAEEGAVEQATAQREEKEGSAPPPRAPWWKRKRCCLGLLALLLLAGAIAGVVVGLTLNEEKEVVPAEAADGDTSGGDTEGGAGGDVVTAEGGDASEGDGSWEQGQVEMVVEQGQVEVVVDRTCEYEQSDTIFVSSVPNGVDNKMIGGISDFDGNDAVVVSGDGGIGAVWALSKDGNAWQQTAFQTANQLRFGWDIALSAGKIVVGAPGDQKEGEVSHPVFGTGLVFVLTKGSDGGWYTEEMLLPNNVDSNAGFGSSVDISPCGCLIAVGAWNDRESRGSVLLYSKSSSGKWRMVQRLSPSINMQSQSEWFHDGNYGHTVAISDTMLAVKAPFDSLEGLRGVVYLYERGDDGKYREIQRLSAPEGPQKESDHSPQVVILDDFVLVGSPGYQTVYVFRRDGLGVYGKVAELTASDSGSNSNFGVKISGKGNKVLVSDRLDNSSYLFTFEGGVWKEKAKFSGYHAALSDNSIVVHSPLEFGLTRGSYGGPVSFYDLVCEEI